MKLKKFGAVLLAMSLTTGLMAGCGGSKDQAAGNAQGSDAAAEGTEAAVAGGAVEACEIEFWHYMTGEPEAALTELTDKFNSENEYGITVKLVNQGQVSDLQSKLTANAASGTLPELALAYNNAVTEFLPEIIDLKPFIESDFDNYEDIIESYRAENEEFGIVSGLPFNKSTYVYFYNKTLFDELGITAPTTWDELYAAGEKMMDAKGVAVMGYDDRAGMMEALVRQAGGQYVTEEGVLFNDESGLAAAEYLKTMYSNGYATLADGGEFFSNLLSNGLIAGYVGSSAGVSYINTDVDGDGESWELGVAPVAANKQGAAYMAGTNLMMFAKDTNEQKAAWEYMKFLTSTESTTTWAIATGYLPVRTSAFESEEYQAFMEENPAAAAAYAQSDVFFYAPTFDASNDLRTGMNTATEEVMLELKDSEMDAETVLGKLVDAATNAVE